MTCRCLSNITPPRELTTEDIALPTLPAADIFDELIYESFRRNVSSHRSAKIGGEGRLMTRAGLNENSQSQVEESVRPQHSKFVKFIPQGSSFREARRESDESAL